jgi:hypothetical protein
VDLVEEVLAVVHLVEEAPDFKMTKYVCHGCGKIYDDEIGMPGKCCDKYIRHKLEDEYWYKKDNLLGEKSNE